MYRGYRLRSTPVSVRDFTDKLKLAGYDAPTSIIHRVEDIMARYAPGSQTRSVLEEKERIAQRLLGQGLTVTQICKQLRCSPQFIRQVRAKVAGLGFGTGDGTGVYSG